MTAFTSGRSSALGALTVIAGALLVAPAQAQNHPISAGQRALAQQVAQQGVPLAELAADAPESYTVKRGDTLWGISGVFLRKPWRWPELWGMNLQEIANPHLIYPGQTLYLDKSNGYARLRTTPPGVENTEPPTIRVSPRTRTESVADNALPTLKPHLIEPFLAEPLVVDADALRRAPRVIATEEERVLMANGDRIYVRGDPSNLLSVEPGEPRQYRVFRDAVALKDPVTGEVLGYEAQHLGKAVLVRGEGFEDSTNAKGQPVSEYVPATFEVTGSIEEIRAGDRLLPTPPRSFLSYVPRAPQVEVDARVVGIYGRSNVSFAAQNQIVVINRGSQDGVEAGEVLTLLTRGERVKDKTEEGSTSVKLPSENNGMVMVFRTFDRVSYALILDIHRTGVRVGDRLINPR